MRACSVVFIAIMSVFDFENVKVSQAGQKGQLLAQFAGLQLVNSP